MKQLERRLRRLEHLVAGEISESQHRWFSHHLAGGRHGMALESLVRWFAESKLPLPDHLREEFEWLATSLGIEALVLPVLDDPYLCDVRSQYPSSSASDPMGFETSMEAFRQLVADAVDALPEAFGKALENVAITVEDEAEDEPLFGCYIGFPLTKRRFRQWNVVPDRIIVYRKTICAHSTSEEEVKGHVYVTVIHEIAHHFGIGDEHLTALGW